MKKQHITSAFASFLLFGFLLGVHNGKVALWKGQDPKPIRVFPYSVSALPPQAQEALRSGIPIESMEDLESLIKKYLP